MSPNQKESWNENGRVASIESVPIGLKPCESQILPCIEGNGEE